MSEKKKVSLAEAMKQRLAQKQEEQANNKQGKGMGHQKHSLKSQVSKKPSNTRRKMGS